MSVLVTSVAIRAGNSAVVGVAMHRSLTILGLVACVAAITLASCSQGAKAPETTTTSIPKSALSPIKFSALPHPSGPSACPDGYVWAAPANPASALCVPYAYVPDGTLAHPNDDTACPAGAHLTMGPALCVSDKAPDIVAPVPPMSTSTTVR